MAPEISSKRSNEVQGILDMIEYRNEIVIWLTEQRNYRGGWISTQVRLFLRCLVTLHHGYPIISGDTTSQGLLLAIKPQFVLVTLTRTVYF